MAKNLAVFMDGTWDNEADPNALSNIAMMHEAAVDDPARQRKHYVRGVGAEWYDQYIGGAVGLGVDTRIRDGYGFLVDNYADGDSIFIFGFSRGAFEARSLAGMIGRVGLLKPPSFGVVGRDVMIQTAWELYRDAKAFPDRAANFKATHSNSPNITMVGVFDTVGALGIPLIFTEKTVGAPEFHDLDLGEQIDNAYQALSIDEQRSDFVPALWNRPSVRPGQTLEQVWFSGVHSDIGGGYTPDHRLSDVTLTWMVARAVKHGLLFTDPAFFKCTDDAGYGTLHNSLSAVYQTRGVVLRNINPGATIHSSVQKRMAAQPPTITSVYAPANVQPPLNQFVFQP